MQGKTEVIQGWGWREAALTLPGSSSPAHPGTNNGLALMIYKHQGERGSFPKSFLFFGGFAFKTFAVKEVILGQGRAGSVQPGEGDGSGCAQSTEPQGWDMGAAKLLWCLFV